VIHPGQFSTPTPPGRRLGRVCHLNRNRFWLSHPENATELFIPEITSLPDNYSGEPVPQQEELLDVLEAYPYPVLPEWGLETT